MPEVRCANRDRLLVDGGTFVQIRPALALAVRIVLAATFVIVCHQFDWILLRYVTAECVFRLSQFLKMDMVRPAADSVELNNIRFQFTVACTQIDVFCGAIPLIWNLAVPVRRNLAKLLVVFVCLFAFNTLRLQFGYTLFAHGVPWILAHDCIAGLNLFLIFLWVVRQAELLTGRPSRTIQTTQTTQTTQATQTSQATQTALTGH